MNRAEYDLVFQALKNYRLYMTKEQEVLSDKILDKLFYPEGDLLFDELSNDDSEINTDWQPDDTFDDTFDEIVKDAEEALASEPEINGVRSLNFR